jgi:isoleucyl-tRNA synthetase
MMKIEGGKRQVLELFDGFTGYIKLLPYVSRARFLFLEGPPLANGTRI